MGYNICTTNEINISLPNTAVNSSNLIYYAGNSLSGTISDNFGKSTISIDYIDTKPDWITSLGITLKDSTAGYIKISVSENTTTSARTCKFRLKNADNKTSSNYVKLTLNGATAVADPKYYLTLIVVVAYNKNMGTYIEFPWFNGVAAVHLETIRDYTELTNADIIKTCSIMNVLLVLAVVSPGANVYDFTFRTTITEDTVTSTSSKTWYDIKDYNYDNDEFLKFHEYLIYEITEDAYNKILPISKDRLQNDTNIIRWTYTSDNNTLENNLVLKLANMELDLYWKNRSKIILFYYNTRKLTY